MVFKRCPQLCQASAIDGFGLFVQHWQLQQVLWPDHVHRMPRGLCRCLLAHPVRFALLTLLRACLGNPSFTAISSRSLSDLSQCKRTSSKISYTSCRPGARYSYALVTPIARALKDRNRGRHLSNRYCAQLETVWFRGRWIRIVWCWW